MAREGLRVFPLLVAGATLPNPDDVPESVQPLLRRHGYPIRSDPDFKPDIARLIAALDVTLGISRPVRKVRHGLFFMLGCLFVASLQFVFYERTYQIAAASHNTLAHVYADIITPPIMANSADLERWKGNILALQDPNSGGIAFRQGQETQVWTTAQALTALLASSVDLKADHDKIVKAFQYIERNRDEKLGGWDYFDNLHSKAITEIAAWVCLSNVQLLSSTPSKLFAEQVPEARKHIERDLASIVRCQLSSPKGAWSPIWVPDDARVRDPRLARTYSTIMALWALAESIDSSDIRAEIGSKYDGYIDDGVNWLLSIFQRDVGLPASQIKSAISMPGLTAEAIYVLMRIERVRPDLGNLRAVSIMKEQFLNLIDPEEPVGNYDHVGGDVTNLQPIGFTLESSLFARFPWILLAASLLRNDMSLSNSSRERATEYCNRFRVRSGELDSNLQTTETWEIAESLFCVSEGLYSHNSDLPKLPKF